MSLTEMWLNKNGRGDFKSAVAPSTSTQTGTQNHNTRSLWRAVTWPLALTCGFLIFVIGSSIYLVVSSGSSRALVERTLRIEGRTLRPADRSWQCRIRTTRLSTNRRSRLPRTIRYCRQRYSAENHKRERRNA